MRAHFFLPVLAISLLIGACSRDYLDSNELGLAELKQYCISNGLRGDDFDQPNIYSDPKYDVVVEYITKTNIMPRHELLVFIKNGRVIERHSMVDDE